MYAFPSLQTWFNRSSQLYLNASPVEDACQVVLVTRTENSSKGNKPIFLGRYDADLTDNPDRSLYRLPAADAPGFTDPRKGIIARCICYAFTTYLLIGQGGNDGWRPLDDSTGCRYYASISDELIDMAADQPVGELEQLNALVLFYMHAWTNPLVLRPGMLRENAEYKDLLLLRLKGDTEAGGAVAEALRGVIAGLPGS